MICSAVSTRFAIYSLTYQSNTQILDRTLTLTTGCGEVWPAKSVLECSVDLLSFVVNHWLSVRLNLLSAAVIGVTGLVCLVTPSISASTAGFALAFASMVTVHLLYMVCFEWRWLWSIFKVELRLGL